MSQITVMTAHQVATIAHHAVAAFRASRPAFENQPPRCNWLECSEEYRTAMVHKAQAILQGALPETCTNPADQVEEDIFRAVVQASMGAEYVKIMHEAEEIILAAQTEGTTAPDVLGEVDILEAYPGGEVNGDDPDKPETKPSVFK